MKLGGKAIIRQFQNGNWRAYRGSELMSPEEISMAVGPNSVDVTLHHRLLIPKGRKVAFSDVPVDPWDPTSIEWVMTEIGPDGFVLPANGFVLGAVRERIVCSSPVSAVPHSDEGMCFAPMYEGRSTCGRLGIESHLAAGFGDYGFGGAFTLELKNNLNLPLILRAGMRIGQIAFDQVFEPLVYKGAYSDDRHYDGPVPPKLGKDRF